MTIKYCLRAPLHSIDLQKLTKILDKLNMSYKNINNILQENYYDSLNKMSSTFFSRNEFVDKLIDNFEKEYINDLDNYDFVFYFEKDYIPYNFFKNRINIGIFADYDKIYNNWLKNNNNYDLIELNETFLNYYEINNDLGIYCDFSNFINIITSKYKYYFKSNSDLINYLNYFHNILYNDTNDDDKIWLKNYNNYDEIINSIKNDVYKKILEIIDKNDIKE